MTEGAEAIPRDVRAAVEESRGAPDEFAEIVEAETLGGGCIHPAARIRFASSETCFLKWSRDVGPAGFDVEARGLRALAEASGPGIPGVLGVSGGSSSDRGWLLLKLVEPGRPDPDTADRLGRELAGLHRTLPGAEPGWEEDGFIGPLPQRNLWEGGDWPRFWVEARLQPQWERARNRMGSAAEECWERLAPRIPTGLEGWEEDGMALLHGDLWSGNVLTGTEGEPVLIDPAVYRGHREVDLAMMELFGGFHPRTFQRYHEVLPRLPGFELRRDIYQLYPLLVHVNLFGGGYVGSVMERMDRLLARLA